MSSRVDAAPQSMKPLTELQQTVLRLSGQGMYGKQIAHELGMTEQMVSKHRKAIKRKLKLANNLALMRYAAVSELRQA